DFVRALRAELGEPSMTAAATAAEEAADEAAFYGDGQEMAGQAAGDEEALVPAEPGSNGWPLPDADGQEAPAPRRRRLGLPLLLGAILLLAAGAAGYLLLRGGDAPKSFSANDVAPFSFSYPAAWKVNEHSNLFVSFAPYDATELFADSNWRGTNTALRGNARSVWGMYTRVKTAGFDIQQAPDDLDRELQAALPGIVTVTDHVPGVVRVDGFPAAEIEGEVTDQGSQGRLHFLYLIVQVDPRGPQTVHMVFFSSPDAFDDARRAEFQRVKDSVRFDRERLKILHS
ncbi:MAG TPA: hypothetical protein VEP73_06920, partial [Actinomycetota bacterium]|nr:hypothetical protein [Actinomycetota bacterium]